MGNTYVSPWKITSQPASSDARSDCAFRIRRGRNFYSQLPRSMKRTLRWCGFILAIGGYIALTVWSNARAGEIAIAHGEAATKSAMQPFWAVIYFGVLLAVVSCFLPARRPRRAGRSDGSVTSAISANPREAWRTLTEDEKARVAKHLRDQAGIGNLRPRKQGSQPESDGSA